MNAGRSHRGHQHRANEGRGVSDLQLGARLADDPRHPLRADCARCVGLCCVAPAFAASADFALDKPAGIACPNLRTDSRCGIHTALRPKGFPGCVVFDCFGAGQQLTQHTFAGRDWRSSPAVATAMFDAFAVLRQLQEFRWYLVEALELSTGRLRTTVEQLQRRIVAVAEGPAAKLQTAAVDTFGAAVSAVLAEVSSTVRKPHRARVDHRGADLVQANFRGAALSGSTFRGAVLIGADFTGADLRHTDLLGADLRAANLGSADLSSALFVTQPQLEAAQGDARTQIPPVLTRPGHW